MQMEPSKNDVSSLYKWGGTESRQNCSRGPCRATESIDLSMDFSFVICKPLECPTNSSPYYKYNTHHAFASRSDIFDLSLEMIPGIRIQPVRLRYAKMLLLNLFSVVSLIREVSPFSGPYMPRSDLNSGLRELPCCLQTSCKWWHPCYWGIFSSVYRMSRHPTAAPWSLWVCSLPPRWGWASLSYTTIIWAK